MTDDTLRCGVKPGETVCGKPAKHQLFVWIYFVGGSQPYPCPLGQVFVCDEHATKDAREAFFEKMPFGFEKMKDGYKSEFRRIHGYPAPPIDRYRTASSWQPIEGGRVIPRENPGVKLVLPDAISKAMH